MAGEAIRFSEKQLRVLTWWRDGRWEALICDGAVRSGKTFAMGVSDGAVRSGKTFAMGLSFFLWAQAEFDGRQFGICGKTIASVRRNLLSEVVPYLRRLGMGVRERRGENALSVRFRGHENTFLLFGGRDESSAALIQGSTLAGVLLDEAALMPRSFVEQAVARCSVAGSRLWFNCNPEGPGHWFYQEWILKAEERRALRLHFTMEDNLSLDEAIKARYRGMYAGVFFLRYIKGLWAVAEGLIYTMCTKRNYYIDEERPIALKSIAQKYIAVDYGTTNPCVFLEIWDDGETVWIDREYRWDSRSEEARRSGNPQKTDAQYADDLAKFMGTAPEDQCTIIVDPSAASFIAELRGRGFYVKPADNEVLDGIRAVATLLAQENIKINRSCVGLKAEMQSYAWDEKAVERGEEKPVKQMDHGCDCLRYFVKTILPSWRIGIT